MPITYRRKCKAKRNVKNSLVNVAGKKEVMPEGGEGEGGEEGRGKCPSKRYFCRLIRFTFEADPFAMQQ